MLFQDEPDEQSSPTLFADEGDEPLPGLFQDEPPERESFTTSSDQHVGPSLLQDEPDDSDTEAVPFAVELDEVDSGSENSAYDGDLEDQPDKSQQALVQLHFSVLNKFLTQNFLTASDPTVEQPKKKYRYNNANRAKAASEKLASKLQQSSGRKRTARNDPAP